jgi:sugar phosphate isomerase/epimerase
MTCTFSRRKFLKTAANLSAGLGLATLASGCLISEEKEMLYKIALAESSLRKTILAGEFDHLDFPEFARAHGFDAIEYWSMAFKSATDMKYLKELKRRADDNGVKGLVILSGDKDGHLDDPDDARREKAVENHYKWVLPAKILGCRSIRGMFGASCPPSGNYDEQTKLAVDGLHRLATLCAQDQLNVIVENHGGMSANASWLASVIKKVNLPNCGTLPDFGPIFNFDLGDGKLYDHYKGVTELMPFAKHISAKSAEFDASGNEIYTDYRRMMKIVVDAGYHGYVSIEFDSHRPPKQKGKPTEVEGIKLTKKLLEKVRKELS